jgi:rubrerythrin
MPLSTEQIIAECAALIRYDYDAIGAYDEAIEALTDYGLRAKLIEFLGDHERHVSDLSAILRRLGGDAPDKPGLGGLTRRTMDPVAGQGSVEGTLRALLRDEEVVAEAHRQRAGRELPEEVLAVVRRHEENEARHREWLRETLRSRSWEEAPARP